MNALVDPQEVAQFGELAARWWDPDGPLRTLHEINPLRVELICAQGPLEGLKIADIGCGGGLLSEALAKAGAAVTGIDMADESIAVAREHAAQEQLDIEYLHCDSQTLAAERAGSFDIVTCLELLEHVPSPEQTVADCAALLRPGGTAWFSTLNRNPKSFLLAIVAAEYLLGMLPRGTHRYGRLIRPAELAGWCRDAGLRVAELTGLHHNPLTSSYRLGGNVDVNYFCRAQRDA